MSFTEILPSPSKSSTKHTSTILLTPQKRKRLSSDASAVGGVQYNQDKTRDKESDDEKLDMRRTAHTPQELFTWTFNQAAVAPCFVKDVFEMGVEEDSCEFFWLGRVPCRTVKIVGMVVGVDNFEDMTRYKVDDGTAVIDCDCKHPRVPKAPSTPKAKRSKPPSKYKPSEDSKPPTSKKDVNKVCLSLPKAFVGATVCVQGRILRGRGSRFLRVEAGHFANCKSANDEPRHWLDVVRLHREHYFVNEPFVIPKAESRPEPKSTLLDSPSVPTPSSPITVSSPSRTDTDSSPVRSSTSSPQRPRLRHPSRLRSHDLTAITFRIYLKHYMDFAPPYRPSHYHLAQGTLYDDDNDNDEDGTIDRCATPTPTSRRKLHDSPILETPKPRTRPSHSEVLTKTIECDEEEEAQYGFTLSYLRRVPVLAEMARGVVRVERKRRERDTRKREKEKASQRAQPSSAKERNTSAQRSAKGKTVSTESTARKIKRLYQKTIRDLYAEGSIVLWDGPRRPLSSANTDYGDGDDNLEGPSCLWKTGTSVSISSSIFSVASASTAANSSSRGITQDSNCDSAAELSEPDEHEEAYLPVTAATVSTLLLRTIREMTVSPSRPASRAQSRPPASGSGRPAPSNTSQGRRRRPPTAEEILVYLHASDARWGNLGSWIVEDGLEKLKAEERVFKAGDGRWALCI